jgi:Zn-dependent protease/predicted transcriptional regulator
MKESFRLGRVLGIPVGVNWSVLVILALFAWSLATVTLPEVAPGYGDAAYWVTAVAVAVVFFACLLAHELAHSVVATHHDVGVDSITLWLLGGVSKLRGEAHDPSSELRIAAAGPAASLGLGLAFGAVAGVLGTVGAPALVVAALSWLAVINVILALFNLVPAAPLDGGRLLHAFVWHRSGDHAAATMAATRAGRWFGAVLVGLGVLLTFGGVVTGLWFVLLGWFLISAARAEATHELLHGAFAGMHVRDVMTASPVVVPADVTVADLVDDWFLHHRCSAFPVVDDEGRATGLVTLRRVRTTDRRAWQTLRARDVADDLAGVATAAPDELLTALLERMSVAPGGDGRALVFEHDHLVGIVSPTDVRRAIDVVALHTRRPRSTDPPRGTATTGELPPVAPRRSDGRAPTAA